MKVIVASAELSNSLKKHMMSMSIEKLRVSAEPNASTTAIMSELSKSLDRLDRGEYEIVTDGDLD